MNSKISFFNPKIAILILFNLVITSCGSAFLSLSTTSQINKGMSMNEVKRILGEPNTRSFDNDSEWWQYISEFSTNADYREITIIFQDSRVTSMISKDMYKPKEYYQNTSNPNIPNITIGIGGTNTNIGGTTYTQATDEYVTSLISKINDKPFDKEKKETLMIGISRYSFTCSQSLRLLNLETFDRDRLKILEIIAHNISDRENYEIIVDSFMLGSQDEAKAIMLRR